MKTYEEELAEWIALWLNTNEKLSKINQYLYNNTQLFEGIKTIDFKEELYGKFAAKITRFSRDQNEIYKCMSQRLKTLVNKERLK